MDRGAIHDYYVGSRSDPRLLRLIAERSTTLRWTTAWSNDYEFLMHSYTARLVRIGLALQLVVVTSGCGRADRPPLVMVTGKVLMQGRPLTAGAIIFHPNDANSFQDDNPSSLLQTDGSFLIKTFPFGNGVPPGKYKVTLAPELATRIQRPEFGDPKKTPWEVEVPSTGLRDHPFEVK